MDTVYKNSRKKRLSLKLKRKKPQPERDSVTTFSNDSECYPIPNLGDSITITKISNNQNSAPPSVIHEPVTPKKQTQITSFLTPSKNNENTFSPSKLKETTPKKTVRLELGDPSEVQLFSPKIKRRPGKFFSKDEMPPVLLKVSPSKPQRGTPKRKALSDVEGTPSPKQRTLDSFLSGRTPEVKKSLNFEATGIKIEPEVIIIDSEEGCNQSDINFLSTFTREWENSFPLEKKNSSSCDTSKSSHELQLTTGISAADNETNITKEPGVTPKKKSPLKNEPTKASEFESFIYYLIKNPMSELAIDNSVLPLDLCAKFFSGFQNLDSGGQHLYARMYGRSRVWYRLTDLNERYSNKCEDIKGLIQVLEYIGFVSKDCKSEDLDTLLNLLQVPELKYLCKMFNQKDNGKRDLLIQRLSKCAKSQKSLFKKDVTGNMKEKLVTVLGDCVRLSDEPKEFFNILLILATYPFFIGKESDRLSNLIDQLNMLKFRKVIYPNYECRPTLVFKTFKALEEYITALKLTDEISTAIENKDWPQASKNILLAKEKCLEYLRDKENIALLDSTKSYLLKFTAGQAYCYWISKGVTVLKKDNSTLDSAVDCLELLLDQKYFILGKRGSWYEELALIYQLYIKDLPKACSIVINGLTDTKISPISKMALSKRGEILLNRKKSGISDGLKLELRQAIDLVNYGKYTPNSETIVAKEAMCGVAGRKQVFVIESEDEKVFSSVEEVVIHHYKTYAAPPYEKGVHDEGNFLMNLVLASFFDIIYCQPLEEESFFHCPMQIKPLDWGSKYFYKHREKLIQDHLNKLREGGIHGLLENLNKVLGMGITCLINWKWLEDVNTINDMLSCLGMEVFLNIAEHVIKDYKSYHSGFPDLMLWDPPSGRCLFVEVKGPSDQLSYHQTVWLKNLVNFGADAIVVHVETPGSTTRKKNSVKE